MTTIPKFSEVTRFVALLKQAEGCDFTIGCGVKVVTLEASTPEEAVVAAKALAWEYRNDENRLESLQILALVGTFDAPLADWSREFDVEGSGPSGVF